MTIKIRRLIVVVPVASILPLANFLVLWQWLEWVGIIEWAWFINGEYITGTAITAIAAMLVLLPSTPGSVRTLCASRSRCPVCDEHLRTTGRCCSACGSRV